jgi:hypothetical protein
MSSSEARRSSRVETRTECEKTLYDKTVARRLRAASRSRRTTRTAAGVLALGLVAASAAAALVPAQAVAPTLAPTTAYGGFSVTSTASPLKLEVFEPAIPIPTEPQFEMDFSYTRVLGDSGPSTTARASAMWPGPAIGEGLKTFGEQLGLPGALTDNGYPVQVNSGFPGDTTQAASEPLPGMVQRVNAGEKRTTAKAGYTPSGDLAEGDPGTPTGTATAPANPLDSILHGDLGALGNVLTGTTTGNADNPVPTNPMGALSLLIDFDGMTSVSSADYDGDKVVSTATSRIGELRLLGGLIKLTGINVVTQVTSTLDGGAKTSQTVDVGGMTVAGQKFSYGPAGFTAAGSTTPVPGLPTQLTDLLKMFGVQIEVPTPVVTADGASGSVDAEAVRITLDTKWLRDKLPQLPLDDLVSQLPDLQQGNILKGMILSLNTIAPKLVLHLGSASAKAETVPNIDFGSDDTSASTGAGTSGSTGGTAGTPGTPATAGTPVTAEVPPAATAPSDSTTPVQQVASVHGLPPLGSIPMLLTLAGLALAGGVGWYLRQAGVILFGGAAACAHGLKAGIPDLRKV